LLIYSVTSVSAKTHLFRQLYIWALSHSLSVAVLAMVVLEVIYFEHLKNCYVTWCNVM